MLWHQHLSTQICTEEEKILSEPLGVLVFHWSFLNSVLMGLTRVKAGCKGLCPNGCSCWRAWSIGHLSRKPLPVSGHPVVKAVYVGTEGECKKPASTICPMHMDICCGTGYCSTSSYLAFLGGSPLYSLAYATQVWEIYLISFHFPNEIFPQLSFQNIFFHKLALILNAAIPHVVTCNKAKISFGLPMKHGNPGKDHY